MVPWYGKVFEWLYMRKPNANKKME
uniref:Uncharacterized protein n=1 Tax=Nelumbo nucifera TaxID=4432 RepID=A0A822XPT1_NELNU|nr:TPA_asm: hypothetical protein HUJ06_022198 [Nelumbo nucifera]